MAFFTNSSEALTAYEQKVGEFRCFLQQNYESNAFAMLETSDWVIREGRDSSSRLIARAQGLDTGSGQINQQRKISFNMLFEDERFKESSLVVHGAWDLNSPVEWAIVGGTGQFTFAQGVVYGKKLSQEGDSRFMELLIHVTYRPVKKPNMN